MIYEEQGFDPKDLEESPTLDNCPDFYTKEIECGICKTKGTIQGKEFIHKCEGEPIPYMDYVICQNCGHKQLLWAGKK